MKDLLRQCAERHDLEPNTLLAPTRKRCVSWPRQEFMARAREAGFSTPQIGRFLGVDHSTVLHGSRAAWAREVGR